MLIPDPHHALQMAQRAMDLAVAHTLRHQPSRLILKGDRDVVTDVDRDVEHLLRDVLLHWDPGIGFVGEEHGAVGDQSSYWVLDPIDGTINFARGGPLCAIALALIHDHQPILGMTALPFLGHRYWAATGTGAYRDGQRITVAGTERLDAALIGLCDYGSGPDAETRDRLCTEIDQRLTSRAQGVRRVGTTALDLVWTADGTLDAAILVGNRTWDTAAGVIIAREAGALVLDADGSRHSTRSRCTLAATPALAEILVPMLAVARDTSYWPS